MKCVSKKKDFKFPEQVLNQINECSNGGFVLFNFDIEGTPQVFSQVDDVSNAMALQLHIQNWSKALEAYNLETAMEQFAEAKDGEDEELE